MEKALNISYDKRKLRNGDMYYSTKGKYHLVRYADDFVIFAKSKEDIGAVHDILKDYLKERGLTLAEDKTRITHTSEGFDFLGFNFKRYKTAKGFKHLSKPSKNSIKQFKSKVREVCKQLQGHNVDKLIDHLNPLIRGTANYWRTSSAKAIFSKMDNYIWTKIYRFVRRLHPNKSWHWIKEKYFPFYSDGKFYGNWILTGSRKGNNLIKMVWTPIRRHIMIKYNYSPYDKSKTDYFAKREFSCFR